MKYLLLVMLVLVLVGCAEAPAVQAPQSTDTLCPTCPPPAEAQLVKQTVIVEQTVIVPQTVIVEQTVIVLQTCIAEPTKAPAPEKASDASEHPPGQIRYEGLGLEQERGGVIIRVNDVIITPLTEEYRDWVVAKADDNPMLATLIEDMFDGDATAIVNLNIEVENTTDRSITVYPSQGTLVIGNEQLESDMWLTDSVGGDMLPGILMDGGVGYLPERTQGADIVEVRYIVGPPNDENYDSLADDDYDFVITLK